MKVRITLTEEMLGTSPANPEVAREFVVSKSADAEKQDEEMAALSGDDAVEKSMTVFPKLENGTPILWDYQLKGFLKDSINALRDMGADSIKSEQISKRLTKYTYKRTMDNLVFVGPRKIILAIPAGTKVGNCQRPLRAETMRGERVALANSETVPAGTTFECEITCLDKRLDPVIVDLLNYGRYKGLGQWRNSGKGRFEWTELA